MKLFQYRGTHPNFGDELNSWLWPKLLPGFFDDDASEHFVGIGSVLGDVARRGGRKIVFGAGLGLHYHAIPQVHDEAWQIYFVRGPRTAARLNLPMEKAVGDPAILLRQQVDLSRRTKQTVSFMPHWESMERGHWEAACALAGVTLIDPRAPVEHVLEQLLASKLVIAEAMHGAIVADALRIPFVPVMPLNPVHRDKWYDWAESLNLTLKPKRLWPSRLTELSMASFTALGDQALEIDTKTGVLSYVKKALQRSPVGSWIDKRLTALAARQLVTLSHESGILSEDAALERATARMQAQLEQLKRDYAR